MPSSPERAYESYNYEFYRIWVVSHASASGESATATLTSAPSPVKEHLLWRMAPSARQTAVSVSFSVKICPRNRPLYFELVLFAASNSNLFLGSAKTNFSSCPVVPVLYSKALSCT